MLFNVNVNAVPAMRMLQKQLCRLVCDIFLIAREIFVGAGWNIGLGVEFGKILVGLDTQLGFCKVMDGDAPHNANIGITLGYKF